MCAVCVVAVEKPVLGGPSVRRSEVYAAGSRRYFSRALGGGRQALGGILPKL